MKIEFVIVAVLFGCSAFFCNAATSKPAWAGNRLGYEALSDDYIDQDFAPIEVDGNTVKSGFKTMIAGGNALPSAMSVKAFPVLKQPVRFVLNGTALTTGDSKTVKCGKNSAVVTSQFTHGGVQFTVSGKVDFDFCITYDVSLEPAGESAEIQQFSMVWPLNTVLDEQKLMMCHGDDPNHPESALDSNKRRICLTLKAGDKRLFETGYAHSVWVGTTDWGLGWNFESAKGWNPVKGNELVFDPASGEFSINLIARPTRLDKAVTYRFYLTPTPIKEMPKNWRTWNYGWRGGPTQKIDHTLFNQLLYWSSISRGGDYNPLVVRNPEEVKKCAAEDQGMGKGNYYVPQLISTQVTWENDEGEVFVLEDPYLEELCSKNYSRSEPKELDIPADAHYFKDVAERNKVLGSGSERELSSKYSKKAKTWTVVFTPEIADHMVYALNEYIKLGVGGIYYDGVGAIAAFGPFAWTDSDGELRSVRHYGYHRELLKRMRHLVKSNDPAELITGHQSGTRPAGCVSLIDVVIPGETYYYWYHEPSKRDASPDGVFYYAHIVGDIDNLKCEFFHRQWGLPTMVIPEVRDKKGVVFKDPRGTRTFLSYFLHFDVLFFPTACHVEEIYKIYRIRNAFGMGDTEELKIDFVPYWENKAFSADDKDVKISYYRKTGHSSGTASQYLVIVSALRFNDAAFRIKMPAEAGGFTVREMQSKRDIPVQDGAFECDLAAYDFAIFQVTSPQKP